MAEEKEKIEENVEIEVEEAEAEENQEEEVIAQEADTEQPSSDSEHEEYSEGVKKRIDRLTYKMREAERREQAALEYAKNIKDENEKLTKNYSEAGSALVTETSGRIKSQLSEAKRALKLAYEEGDSEAMADAQELVAKLSVESDRLSREEAQWKQRQEAGIEAEVEDPKQAQSAIQNNTQTAAPVDPRAQKWASENEWFGKDEGMTFTAFSIHRKLIEEEGYNPQSEDYYTEINSRMRKEFPHKFGEEKSGQRKPAQTVAPANRSSKTGRKTVRLTQSQVAIAKKLGVPLEEYAKHVKEA
jgi:hypothetical protein|tara:strand:+ start:23496 stop:24398 length:903 start_codon:yes stop_codon:yes gene_type:complete